MCVHLYNVYNIIYKPIYEHVHEYIYIYIFLWYSLWCIKWSAYIMCVYMYNQPFSVLHVHIRK